MPLDLNSIWLNFQAELQAFVNRKVGNRADADDILQDVFLKIMGKQDRIAEAVNLRKYLYGMVRNSIADLLSNQKKRAEAPGGIESTRRFGNRVFEPNHRRMLHPTDDQPPAG